LDGSSRDRDPCPIAGVRSLNAMLKAPHCGLTHLDLRNNRLSPAGAMILAEALPHNSSLKSLDLRWNCAGDDGARHLEGALAANHTLMRLPLQGNRVLDNTLRRIASLLGRNGADASGVTNYLALSVPPQDEPSGAPRGMAQRSLVIRTKALEGALTLQQEEFTNKLSHVKVRMCTADPHPPARESVHTHIHTTYS